MAKKQPARRPVAKGRIVLRTGEALVEDEAAWSAAEPEVVIGELDGPVGYAIANLLGDQTKGHSRVFAILNSDVQVRPATLMVSKVTVKSEKYTNILMGTVQAAIAHGVLDAVRAGDIPKKKANDLGIIVSSTPPAYWITSIARVCCACMATWITARNNFGARHKPATKHWHTMPSDPYCRQKACYSKPKTSLLAPMLLPASH